MEGSADARRSRTSRKLPVICAVCPKTPTLREEKATPRERMPGSSSALQTSLKPLQGWNPTLKNRSGGALINELRGTGSRESGAVAGPARVIWRGQRKRGA